MKAYKYELMLLLSTIAYGVSYPISKYAQGYIGTFPLMSLRGVLGFATMALWYARSCRRDPSRLEALRDRSLYGYTFISSLLGGGGMYLSMYALNYTMASKASFFTCTYVLMMPVLAFIFFRGRSSVDQIIALLVATGGMALISGVVSGEGLSLSQLNRGDIMTLCSAVLIAFQAVYFNWFSKRLSIDVEAFTTVQMAFTTCVYIVGWRLLAPDDPIVLSPWPVAAVALFVGVGVAGFAFLAFNLPIKMLPPARSAVILATEPIFGALGAYFIRDRWGNNEVLTPLQMLGCAIVLASVLCSELYGQKKARALPAQEPASSLSGQ